MRSLIIVALMIGSTLAFAGRLEPVYNAEMSYEASISDAKVEKAIKKALIQRGWRAKETTSGKVKAHITLRSHTANTDITYGNGSIKFTYVNSTNLKAKQKKGEQYIHRNYNRWIMNLEKDINAFLLD